MNSAVQSPFPKLPPAPTAPRVRRWLTPGDFCRLSPSLTGTLRDSTRRAGVIRSALLLTFAGASLYGFVFGFWRAPQQALISAVKLPFLFFAVVAASAAVNTVLIQVMGHRLTFRQVCSLILSGMAVSAIILGAWTPVALFLVLQIPGPDPALVGLARTDPAAATAMRAYEHILLAHTTAVGAAGVIGNFKLYYALHAVTGSVRSALRVLAVWLATMGFVGFQLSWLTSPFLCDPVHAPHWVGNEHKRQNVYEYLWQCAQGNLR